MTKKEKIEYTVLAVVVIAIGGVLYFYLFKPAPAPAPAVSSAMSPITSSATPAVPGSPSGTAGASSILPSGTKLQTAILSNPAFTSLVQPVYPQVNPSEVGNPNLFIQPAAPASIPPAQ